MSIQKTMLQKINELQKLVYYGYSAQVEVETRDLGWKAADKDRADQQFRDAVNAYESAFDMQPEFGEVDGHLRTLGKRPLFDATPERIMQICGKE